MKTFVEYVRAKFPIKNIPNIIGEPTYKAINEIREALYLNAAVIPTMLGGGGGRNIHISLLMDAEVYTNIASIRYTRSTDSGPYIRHGPGDTAAAQSDTHDIRK